MPNHLSQEHSPYLLQHSHNPVEWYPWRPKALAKSRDEDKPIFLSIGYAACHWCHVMEHESFEDPSIAAILNENFISIKVDREERPDLDSIYMQAVVAMTGQGGWPMSVFLTPEGMPFYGGTYFPPTRRYNLPSFKDVLLTISRLWREDRAQLLNSANKITNYLQSTVELTDREITSLTFDLDEAVQILQKSYDWEYGGWGTAPKFPQPMVIEFLLRRATRGDKLARDMAINALKAMAKGGMYDIIGGGFARYSIDKEWRIPHFEKMLYDNAQLALVYLHAFLITGNQQFRLICEGTLDFIIREMLDPFGGFYSSLDADSDGKEGAFYVWSLKDIQTALPNSHHQAIAIAAFGVTPEGNFEGNNILWRALSDEQLSKQFSIPVDQINATISVILKHLGTYRGKRMRPATDDKIILFWNAMMLTAFAEAGRYLQRPDYTKVAIRNGRFILKNLLKDGRLLRSLREENAGPKAFLEDFASFVLAQLSLYQSDPNSEWFMQAISLANQMVELFSDLNAGFYDTPSDHESLLLRPKDLQDNATPSGNALAAFALQQLYAYTGISTFMDLVELTLRQVQNLADRHPTAFAQWLSVIDFYHGPISEIAIVGVHEEDSTNKLLEVLWNQYRPRTIAAISTYPIPIGSPQLLEDRTMVNNSPTAYVCQNHICQYPVTNEEEFSKLLSEQ